MVTVADDQKVRIAWLYYMEGKTQDEIATIVGTNRARVLRILAQARADGTVQIKVTSRMSHCIRLEMELKRKCALDTAIVVPSPEDPSEVSAIIGRTLGTYLSQQIKPQMTIGLGWGSTLSAGISAIEPRNHMGISVISMLGGLTRVSKINPSEFAWRVADRLAADCNLIAAPVFAPDNETREKLLAHSGINEVIDQGRRLDMVVVSVGNLSPECTFTQYGLLDKDEIISLEQAGAVGDILCRFVDKDGKIIDHPVNDRVVAVDPRNLTSAREIVLASGGWQKIAAMRAAIRLLKPTTIITDSIVAEWLLQD